MPSLTVSITCHLPTGHTEEAILQISYDSTILQGYKGMDLPLIDISQDSTQSSNLLAHIVVQNVDLSTLSFKQHASVDAPYLIQLQALDSNYNPISVYESDLKLSFTKLNTLSKYFDTTTSQLSFTHEHPLECYLTDTGIPCADSRQSSASSEFTFLFTPSDTGVFVLSSPYMPV